ncbi:MAG: zinc ABC transporter substrate-binding protein [Firmicutes bacterium]|nr:zinc ABC transporter substrate-binding protein [Bacillota bacterium]
MKKILLLCLAIFLTTGCSLQKDDLENATIYTTVYPIEYLINTLYKDYSTVSSIYPTGADIKNYELTKKQIKKYADAHLFIYNGLSNEKNITKNLINENKNLLIIDVSYGLSYTYGIEELWMSPNNYLMLAKNIRDHLTEYLDSKLIIESVNEKYNSFAETISLMDADLRAIGKEATKKDTNTLVVTNDIFKFLTNYGFNIISLDQDTLSEATLSNMIKGFQKETYNSIIISDNEVPEEIAKVIEKDKITKIHISTMIQNPNIEEDYIIQMQRFIDNIRNLVLSD